MNRRRLILTAFGALASLPFASQVVENVLAAPKSVSFVSAAPALVPKRKSKPQVAELFVSVGSDVSAAVAGLTALGSQLDMTAAQFQKTAPTAVLLVDSARGIGYPSIGSLIIRDEREARWFIRHMAEAIANAKGKPGWPASSTESRCRRWRRR